MNGLTETLDPSLARRLLRELGEDARAYRFEVAPNPSVGAAVLAGTRVVARGFHRVWGGPHAEVDALESAAAQAMQPGGVSPAEWDTLLVTLEPCSTVGKTPACVGAILRTGIRRVIVGALDPDPRHRGRGLTQLEAAGVEVLIDPVAAPLETVAPHFLRWNDYERRRRPRPWTIAKWAQTLTGQLTPPGNVGGGRWISGPASIHEVHLLRSRVDAIVTGVGTVLHDDPRLSVRLPDHFHDRVGDHLAGQPLPDLGSTRADTGSKDGTSAEATDSDGAGFDATGKDAAEAARPKAPARIVLDSWLRTPPEAKLFAPPSSEGAVRELAGPVHIMALPGSDPIRRRALEAVGAQVHSNRGMDRHTLDLRDLWTWLWEQGFQRVMVEAGPTLLQNALERGFVDQIRIYTGDVRGGEGESLAPWLTTAKLGERVEREVGTDSVLEAFLD